MKVTKRDIADISLVWIALSFIPYLFNYAISTLVSLCLYEPSNTLFSTPASMFQLFVGFGQLCIMFAFFWILLFKRNLILNLLFPGSEDKALELSGDYSFWIKIFGLYIGLHSGIQLISNLFRLAGISRGGQSYFTFIWSHCGTYIITFIFSVLVIWKAQVIAKYLKCLDSKNKN